MKNTCYLFGMVLIGLIASMQCALCQQQRKPAEGVTSSHSSTDYKWDISLDAYRFRASPAMNPFFTLRYAPNPRGALRWTIGALAWARGKSARDVDSSGTLPANAEFKLHRRAFNIGTSVGYEFRRNLRLGQLLYGVDAWLYWNNNYQYASPVTRTSMVNLSLAPFCGYKYQLSKRFSASIESCMNFSYQWQSAGDRKHGFSFRNRDFGIEPSYISKLNFTFHF